jgi:RNA polymerase sigma-70 factor (ECF subfamily)
LSTDLKGRLQEQLKGLFGFAFTLTRDQDTARDLVQDTAVKALSAVNVPHNETAFRVWLFRILHNKFIDQTRRHSPSYVDPSDLEQAAGSDQWDEERQITVLAVREAFQSVSSDHRDVLALVDIAGMSYDEAAGVLDVPRGTIMSRISRARASLVSKMESDNVTPFPGNRKQVRN